MRRNLVEVVFESIALESAWKFVEQVTKSSQRLGFLLLPGPQVEGSPRFPETFHDMQRLFTDPAAAVAVTVAHLDIPGGYISDPTIWIRPYQVSDYAVEINFYTSAVSATSHDVTETLHSFAASVAVQVGARTCYAGLEPAGDPDTRLFTDQGLGPLSWEDVCAL